MRIVCPYNDLWNTAMYELLSHHHLLYCFKHVIISSIPRTVGSIVIRASFDTSCILYCGEQLVKVWVFLLMCFQLFQCTSCSFCVSILANIGVCFSNDFTNSWKFGVTYLSKNASTASRNLQASTRPFQRFVIYLLLLLVHHYVYEANRQILERLYFST